MNRSEQKIRAAIAEQAGEWFIANQAGALSDDDGAAFLAWLKASPIHVKEYLGVARIARNLGAAVGPPQVPLESFLAELDAGNRDVLSLESPTSWRAHAAAPRPRWWAWPVAGPLAAALVLLIVGGLWLVDGDLLPRAKTYQTMRGEQSVQRLADGSVLRLDTDSAVTVRYTRHERVVEVTHGQVLFQVAHDSNRRFRVVAGTAGAIAVGTQFDIYRKIGVTIVTVVEGQVAVFAGEPSWLRDERGGAPAYVQRVNAGYEVRVDASGMSAQPAAVDLSQSLAWLQHKIVFDHRPLGEVAAEFNRYGRIPVEIEDATLRTLPVSGMFDAGDTDSFVAFLARLPGVTVERTPARIRVMRMKPSI